MRLFNRLVLILGIAMLGGCASDGGRRIDNIPMYGQPDIERPEFLKDADEKFIERAVKGVGSREEASVMWWLQGEKYMNEGNLDYAMRRYNQSWLLNPDNYQPYWGFGRVTLARGEYEESFKHFKRANELVDDPYEKPAVLADTAAAYHRKAKSLPETSKAERQRYFELANSHYRRSTEADPSYAHAWRSWAYSLYWLGEYEEAWGKVAKARALQPGSVSEEFLNRLRAAMPEPAP